MHHVCDPLGKYPWRTVGYVFLSVFFTRLAIWYLIVDRWGEP